MDYTSDIQDHMVSIRLKGQFTFNDNKHFRGILSMLDRPGISTLSLHFDHVEFIDSAALGMLLLLRDEAATRKISLELRGATGQTLKMFSVAQFNTIF
jgi:anti-anti-sigma factor